MMKRFASRHEDKWVDLRELMITLAFLSDARPTDKLRFCFETYGEDMFHYKVRTCISKDIGSPLSALS